MEENNMNEGFDFMFYESYRDTIEQVRSLYGEEDAGTFCLELIRFGVRRESQEKMSDKLQATLEGIKPYIIKSKEKRDKTAEMIKNYYRPKKAGDGDSTSAKAKKQGESGSSSQEDNEEVVGQE